MKLNLQLPVVYKTESSCYYVGFHTEEGEGDGIGVPPLPSPKKFDNCDVIIASTATIGYTTQ